MGLDSRVVVTQEFGNSQKTRKNKRGMKKTLGLEMKKTSKIAARQKKKPFFWGGGGEGGEGTLFRPFFPQEVEKKTKRWG